MPRPRFRLTSKGKIPYIEAEEKLADSEEQAWKDSKADRAGEYVRKVRNRLLKETDWMANSDVTMSDTWKTYRQTLRDLPETYPDMIALETSYYNKFHADTKLDDDKWPTKP